MKYLFDIDGIAFEIELNNGETKRIEYKEGQYANVSLRKNLILPTENEIGCAYLRVEFVNGNIWRSKDAIIPKLSK